ncbi:hypothetical protein Slin15195_G114980 [Septoria linicola]|uniref:Uncharacterized protein n=1 Tax=Septoria linicola TaxID=215465 RepID=A0A9Q9AZQ0_9PEZI|nr:hypothetical protein Slin14017_G122950 [Septoria linicola]USW58179.1 hypothetical protein Slin15195_G114980 [Septoria linicola]
MCAKLLDLSDELLSHICSYAMTWRASAQQGGSTFMQQPDGVVSEQISKRFRELLQPFRCCQRLYKIARHEYLESNVIVLNLSDIRGSASRLEFTSGKSQMIMTGNPDPLLRSIVHVQLVVSISDMRAPFSQPFASPVSGRLWRSGEDVLSLSKEAESLKRLTGLCPNLRTLHIFLKVDEWVLYGKGPYLRKVEGVAQSDACNRYRRHAEAMAELAKEVPLKTVSVSFGHWRGDVAVLKMVDRDADEIIDACLMPTVRETLSGPMAQVR